jgi:hypothetical protein
MTRNTRLIAIYTTMGDVGGFLRYPYIFNRQGEWIGWVTPDREVYSVHGHYVGWLNDDPRVLRKVSSDHHKPQYVPPNPPEKIAPPASVPLAPMMAELTHGVVDVLDDAPHLMPSVDFGDLREDMD